jgi:LmbE family N-acetylglucosaminyl deacetylase
VSTHGVAGPPAGEATGASGGAAAAGGPRAGERWLVVAPHPDDETIATGGLLQRARAQGAAVQVLLLTDGDANPWPQRWLERRWRIRAADRARWAARRRDECRAALAELGLDAERELVALGWPDGGVTDRLASHTAAALREVGAVVDAFAPTHVVLPAADDRHPDHNVVPVLFALTLAGRTPAPALLAYRVHGAGKGDALLLAATAAELSAKRRALACHRTQLALSAGRFERLAVAVERYDRDPFGAAASREAGWPAWLERPLLRLQGRWRWRLVVRTVQGAPAFRTIPASPAGLPSSPDPDAGEPIFTKLEPGRRGPWIYDAHGWRRGTRAAE